MPKNKSSPGEKADFFAFPSRFTILGQVRKNTIPIYLPTKRPRIGTIMKNHIQSSSGLSKAALFVCSESDTSLKNYITNQETGDKGDWIIWYGYISWEDLLSGKNDVKVVLYPRVSSSGALVDKEGNVIGTESGEKYD